MKDTVLGPGSVEWLGVCYKTILTAEQTGGAMSIVDSVSPPGSGPPRHVHHDADETFVTLTGACDIWLEGSLHRCGPGESFFVPRGRAHTFRIVSETESRHLVILTPGGFEGFFAEMAAGGYRIPEDMAAIARIAQGYRLELTGPPLE